LLADGLVKAPTQRRVESALYVMVDAMSGAVLCSDASLAMTWCRRGGQVTRDEHGELLFDAVPTEAMVDGHVRARTRWGPACPCSMHGYGCEAWARNVFRELAEMGVLTARSIGRAPMLIRKWAKLAQRASRERGGR
jgi:hypothetical protein